MSPIDKRSLSERGICTKFITPALQRAGWDVTSQIREEVYFTKGRIIVRGTLVTRREPKRADYILYIKPNIPLAVIEAKDNSHGVGDGMQQALYCLPDHLALVESAPEEAHPFPRRPQRARQPDDGERLPAVRPGHGEAVDECQDHRA